MMPAENRKTEHNFPLCLLWMLVRQQNAKNQALQKRRRKLIAILGYTGVFSFLTCAFQSVWLQQVSATGFPKETRSSSRLK